MTACSGDLQRALHALLAADVGKVELEIVLMLVELLARVDEGGLILAAAVEETDDIRQVVHAVDVKVVHHGGFAHIGLGNNQPLELLLTGTDGYGKGAADGFELPVKPQFPDHHVVGKHRLAYFPVGGQDADG